MTRITLVTRGPEHTRGVGRILGARLEPGDLVSLGGDLGAGKTCLTQGIARGLGVPEGCYVRSPSFVILNIYPGRVPLYHMDLYRIVDPSELEDIGYRDIFFGEGVSVVEWADKVPELLPEDRFDVLLRFLDETRREIVLGASGEAHTRRLASIETALLAVRD